MTKKSANGFAWFPYVDLACVALAGAIWYIERQAGAWPLLLALAPWGVRLVLTGRPGRRTPFDAPLLLFLLTAGVSVWAAYDRPSAWHKFWLIMGSVLMFYAFVHAAPLAEKRAWLLGFWGAGGVLLVLLTHDWEAFPSKISILTHLGQALQPSLPPFLDHSPHLNIVGNILAMLLPFAGLAAIRAWQGVRCPAERRTLRRWLLLGAGWGSAALILFGLVMTTSRGAWLAVGVMGLLLGLWWVSARLSRHHAERQRSIFAGLLGLVLLLALGVGLAWPGGLFAAVDALPGSNTLIGRGNLWRSTPILLHDYPFIGAGLDGFEMLYSTYVLLIHVGFTPHSHNLFLNVAVEQGLPALLTLVWMWGLFAWAVWRGVLGPDRRPASALLAAAALSLTTIWVHGLVDNSVYGSHGLLFLFVPLAFAVPFVERQPARVRSRSDLFLPVGIGLLLILALIGRRPILSLVYSNLGAVHQSRSELGVYSWPEWPVQDAVRRAVDLGRPVAEFERALALNPRNAAANRRLGMIELSLGEYEAALVHLERAYAVEPWSVTTRQLYGEALIVNGRVDEGRALWQDVNNAQGQLRLRALWYRYIGDKARAKQIEEASKIP